MESTDDGNSSSTSGTHTRGAPFSLVVKHVPWALPIFVLVQVSSLVLILLGAFMGFESTGVRFSVFGVTVLAELASIFVLMWATRLAEQRAKPRPPMSWNSLS